MGSAAKKLCRCGAIKHSGEPCSRCGSGRCVPPPRTDDANRGNSTERGYGSDWQRVRLAFLQHNPLCQDCQDAGRTAAACEVHHVAKVAVAPERRLDWDNLRALCKPCHSRRTARGE